jgi:predicted nuclease with TOPRIM domain
VIRKNAVEVEEKAMNRLIQERHCLQMELTKLSADYAITTDLKERADILDHQSGLQAKLNYIQEEVMKYQKNIVDLEDQVVEVKKIHFWAEFKVEKI